MGGDGGGRDGESRRVGAFRIKQRIVRNTLRHSEYDWIEFGWVVGCSRYHPCRHCRGGVQLYHVGGLVLTGVGTRRVGARHAVFAGVVLAERVLGRGDGHVGTAGTADLVRREHALGEEAEILGLGDSFGGGSWGSGARGRVTELGRRHCKGGQEMVWLIKVSCYITLTDFTSRFCLRLSQHIALHKNLFTWDKKYTLSNAACPEEVRHASQNADSACPFLPSRQYKKGHAESAFRDACRTSSVHAGRIADVLSVLNNNTLNPH